MNDVLDTFMDSAAWMIAEMRVLRKRVNACNRIVAAITELRSPSTGIEEFHSKHGVLWDAYEDYLNADATDAADALTPPGDE
jgi:hypothetical protein